ncbi:hypothetical protein DR086_01305 [Mycoplasma hyopneumoniae]|nr:hypothetical protein [Mesomycoplasma hyopneumoniae]
MATFGLPQKTNRQKKKKKTAKNFFIVVTHSFICPLRFFVPPSLSRGFFCFFGKKSRVSQFDGKNSLFSEYEYAEIPVNRCFLPVKP